MGKWKTIQKKGSEYIFKGSIGKFALLVLKHITKQQVTKWNDFVFQSVQRGFCHWKTHC